MRKASPRSAGCTCARYPKLRIHDCIDALKTGMNPNVDIKSHRELTLVDWVWISGTLIFVALMCSCIVLLAHGANQSATTQIQAVLRVPTSLQPRSESNREAHTQSITAVALPETDSGSKSSSEVLSQPTQRILSHDATDELATTNPRSAKVIRENRRNSAVTRLASYRRSAVDKGISRSVKMLIKMWRRTSRTIKWALNDSH
jgi:hypothetical protein